MTTRQIGKAVRAMLGLAVGVFTAVAELVFVVVTAPALIFAGTRRHAFRGARVLAEVERRRIESYLDDVNRGDYPGERAWRYLAVRWLVGGLGAGILLLGGALLVASAVFAKQVVLGQPIGGGDPAEYSWYDPLVALTAVVVLAFLVPQGVIGVTSMDRKLAKHFFGPTQQEVLRRRVSELTVSRAEVVEAVNEERRRIERALHDGVQQRLVALGMLIGRVRRADDPEHAATLLRQAHADTAKTLTELREVTWRIYPVALDDGGLAVALESLAERASIPVSVRYGLAGRAPLAVETIVYFVVSEAMSNALKHADATRLEVDVGQEGNMLTVRIADDGIGGADEDGGGLSGLARRVAAADGKFTVDSPAGGPTVITASLPCE